jgi:hypothetical protein
MGERIITLNVSYDTDAVAREFHRYPGDYSDPPIESVEFLIQAIVSQFRLAIRRDPALRVCEVDVLTVDHRTPPPRQAATDTNADYF